MLSKEINVKALRRNLGLNQSEFWGRLGVTQSAGSRYESGRRMPKPVMELLRICHIERIDLSQVHAADLALLDYIKASRPELLMGLRSAMAGTNEPQIAQGGTPVAGASEAGASSQGYATV